MVPITPLRVVPIQRYRQFKVTGLSKAEHVSFYSVGGQLILQEKGHDDGTLSVSLTSLPKGICIVRLQSGVSYKFFNK